VSRPGAVPKRICLLTADLLFRSKLGAVVAAAGGEVTRDEAACDLAVVDLADAARAGRVGEFVGRGIPVLAYGSHVRPELLRAARDAGARAVPNSQVAQTLNEMLR
jgi:hypothetical protein